ncbi:MAG: dienelactone hydrolase family protein [Burkholderiales bacterium]|nr:dienelactone hydrolase family protein [Burkholderiales bacterium]MDE1928266.1 dienelactone hydrolase family protein [Burkholderiales bacterium]MDE2158786.1 dienelactone hydrolase family protein [Burkholderiales bacterium]MDE2501784.1 dienelactone hydrolase family protein [Burkholderiales bacterium]
MKTQWIEIAPGYAGYLALPPAGRGPGLVLWQEIFGVNAHIRGVAEQYALAGFVVLAPDLFWRGASRVELGYVGADRERGIELMSALGAAEIESDLDAAAAALRARPEVGGAKVGGIGYCFGGRLAYLAAARGRLDAAVAYYGGGIQQKLDLAAAIACPMQFHYAGHDDHIPPAAVAAVRAAMAGAEVHVYADAQHGFNCWDRAAYHAPSAALAHGRALTFLARHLYGL